jgi:hypothetical protein
MPLISTKFPTLGLTLSRSGITTLRPDGDSAQDLRPEPTSTVDLRPHVGAVIEED